MGYYFLRHAIDLHQIGKFPQLEKMFDGFNMKRRYEAWGISDSANQPPMKQVAGFQIKYHAKITDWISAAQFGPDIVLVSEHLFQTIKKFSIMKYVAVPAIVDHRKKSYSYQFVYFPESHNQFVDYSRSRFLLKDSRGNVAADGMNFENMEQFNKEYNAGQNRNSEHAQLNEYEKVLGLGVEEIVFDDSKTNLDFFMLKGPLNAFVVSDAVKQALEEAGITGVRFHNVLQYNI